MITFKEKGFTKEVAGPEFGNQDVGYSPGGAMDLHSLELANAMLGKQLHSPAYEIKVFAPTIIFNSDCTIILTGAERNAKMNTNEVSHGVVTFVNAGQVLEFGDIKGGFRTYLAIKPGHDHARQGRRVIQPEYGNILDKMIFVIRGPEYPVLNDPHAFLNAKYTASTQMSDMGIKLDGPRPEYKKSNMVSAPVADGTIQLTDDGPIILLRNRQTVGGYPRIFNVVSSSINKLAQIPPGGKIRFVEVGIETAQHINKMATLKEFYYEVAEV